MAEGAEQKTRPKTDPTADRAGDRARRRRQEHRDQHFRDSRCLHPGAGRGRAEHRLEPDAHHSRRSSPTPIRCRTTPRPWPGDAQQPADLAAGGSRCRGPRRRGGVAAGYLQHPPVFNAEALMPKFERISPMAGLKRLLGWEALCQFRQGPRQDDRGRRRRRRDPVARPRPAGSLRPARSRACLPAVCRSASSCWRGMLAVHITIAGRITCMRACAGARRLRMSKEEIKQEMKESEGNPEIKGSSSNCAWPAPGSA